MDTPINDRKILIENAFQSAFGNEDLLFPVVDLFPLPIKIFTPDGNVAFANRAVLEMWNISDPTQIVGKYNLKMVAFGTDKYENNLALAIMYVGLLKARLF